MGVITDQDLRKFIEREQVGFWRARVKDVMTARPKTIAAQDLVAQAIRVTEDYSISTLFVVDREHHPVGVVHLHDLLKAYA